MNIDFDLGSIYRGRPPIVPSSPFGPFSLQVMLHLRPNTKYPSFVYFHGKLNGPFKFELYKPTIQYLSSTLVAPHSTLVNEAVGQSFELA